MLFSKLRYQMLNKHTRVLLELFAQATGQTLKLVVDMWQGATNAERVQLKINMIAVIEDYDAQQRVANEELTGAGSREGDGANAGITEDIQNLKKDAQETQQG